MQHVDPAMILAVADWFVERVADRVVRRLEGTTSRSTYADAKNNPLGSARAFLDAGRRGDFPTFKRGRQVVALWADVERYIQSKQRARRERTPADSAEDDRALLESAGVRLRGSRPTSPRRAAR